MEGRGWLTTPTQPDVSNPAAFNGGIGAAAHSDAFADWGKLQTAFGLVRALGGGEPLAWIVQGVVALLAAGAIAVLWRSRAPYEIKAAGLGTAALLATPHLLTYDLVVLAVPLAFLFRLGLARGDPALIALPRLF